MGWQIDRLTIATELPDCAERCAGHVVIGADPVYATRQHQLLIIRSVASEKVCDAFVSNQNGEMIRRMTGSCYRDHVPGVG